MKKLLAFALSLCLIVTLFSACVINIRDDDESDKKDPVKVTAEDLMNAYEENEVAAKKKYEDKLIDVTGTITDISATLSDQACVTLSAGGFGRFIKCYFEDDDTIDDVAKLEKGQAVTIRGECDDLLLLGISVDDCTVVDFAPADYTPQDPSTSDMTRPTLPDTSDTTDPTIAIIPPADESPIEVTAAALFAAYNENEVAAKAKYGGKKLKVTGTVENISYDFMDQIYVTLATDEMFYSVQCYFISTQEAKVAELSKGQTITIIGTCEGLSLNVLMENCEIL